MVEKKLFVQALKHYCDTIWEYEKLSDRVYVHCDKIAEEAEGNAYTLAELIRLFRETYHFTTGDSLWESYLNEAYLQSFFEEEGKKHDAFQIRFRVQGDETKYYMIRMEKIDAGHLIITGKNIFDEVNEKSLHRSLHKSFDCILNIDVATGVCFASYSTDPADFAEEGMDYAARTAHFVDTYVAESEKAQILQATKLERVKQELETKEDYTLFITAFDEKKGFVYKRVMYSYYDANKKMITISRLDISSLVERYEAQIKKLRKENDLDALTGAYNRNYYETNLKDTSIYAGVAVIDLDDFKFCNDAYGHTAGDAVLVGIARSAKAQLDVGDALIRYGGDEFLLIVSETGAERFAQKLERIREAVWKLQIPGHDDLRLSVSIGGVLCDAKARESVEQAVQRADRLMYQAKKNKNRVVTENDAQNEADAQAAAQGAKKEQQQILIVDDSELNRMMLREMLQDDFRILEAADGAACLEMLEQYGTGISLVLLDILMPGLTGFDVLIDMNKNNRMENIPVIMITADDSDANIRRAFSLGALDYISRPFDSQIVYRRVSNTIMLYTKQRKLISMLTQQYREREK